jgi:hypothetical protein
MACYPVQPKPNETHIISLDNMARLLEVERRRIYDIVNVLESVEILTRRQKNQYTWHGFERIHYTMAKLKVSFLTQFIPLISRVLNLCSLLDLDTVNQEQVLGVHKDINGWSA